LRILEAIRILGLEKKARFYQASTSELYGLVQEMPKKKQLLSILAAHTQWLSYMPTGLRLTTARRTAFMPVTHSF
jgi:hypothetical protein